MVDRYRWHNGRRVLMTREEVVELEQTRAKLRAEAEEERELLARRGRFEAWLRERDRPRDLAQWSAETGERTEGL